MQTETATPQALEKLAARYLWWEPPRQALERPARLLLQLMQLGTEDDVWLARAHFGDEAFKDALRTAPPGVLDARSWNYWHKFYGLPVPPMPVRTIP